MILLYLALFALLGGIGGYNSKMQGVTLYFGRYMAKDNELAGPNGFQDAITPGFQDKLNGFVFVALIAVAAGFFIFKWYVPIAGIISYFVVAGVSAAFAPKKLYPYIGKIVGSLARRSADYAKKGDHERSSAAKDVGQLVSESSEELYVVLGKDATVDQLIQLVSAKN